MLNLICGLKRQDIKDVSVIIPSNGDVCKELTKLDIKFCIIPFVNESYDYTKPPSYIKMLAKKYYNLFLVAKHKHQFKKNKNLIIHTNTSVTFFGAYLAHSLKVPHIWHIREFGKADYNFIYNFSEDYFRKWINKAAAVICISNALYNNRIKNKIEACCKIIYNGIVSENTLDENINLIKKNEVFRFGMSGHISDAKNQAEAIKAVKQVSKNFNCELWIAGTGDKEYIDELQSLIKQLKVETQVKFTGFINDVSEFYRSLDCLLVCAKSEALGRVTIEAMSEGVPVIGFDNAGTSEIIKDGYNGVLYNNSYTELAEKMEKLIKNYESFTLMRRNALKTVKENFTIENCALSVLKLYNKTIEQELISKQPAC